MLFSTFIIALGTCLFGDISQGGPVKVAHTFYGFPDNDPAGPATAYNCGRNFKAGGTGTFEDPLTFASAVGEFEQCEIIYDPYLAKYLRYEDFCQTCDNQWKNGIWHIDVWTGHPDINGGGEQIDCENRLTPASDMAIVRRPSRNLSVDIAALYNPTGHWCSLDHVHPNFILTEDMLGDSNVTSLKENVKAPNDNGTAQVGVVEDNGKNGGGEEEKNDDDDDDDDEEDDDEDEDEDDDGDEDGDDDDEDDD